ncbi:MAG: YdeI/OmpD-associated family protein [Nanoarchaeota archaeon]|nr:YdeI/OmpD-associated family protein [Nanoarchaeota archaeon]MBU1051903.1 YdeI/OmpD-associated family protein [Nanoarchaeota archaeon]
MPPKEKIETLHAHSAKEWRAWLEKNHKKKDIVFMTKYKIHTKKPSLTHQEAMDEAICFGWIDTTAKRVNNDVWGTIFVKRKPTAKWSKNTLSYAKQLIKNGRMTPAGLAAYNLSKDKPTTDHNIPKDTPPPTDLMRALSRHKQTKANWDSLAPSARFMYVVWIERAKQEETRRRRIRGVVERMRQGIGVKKGKGKY